MNGETKMKLKAGLVGAVITLIFTLAGIAFGYGQLNSRVDAMESRVSCIEEIRERLVRVETLVERIDKKIGN
jgi:translation elongation factor EF-1beta